jgi:hypothetical protein
MGWWTYTDPRAAKSGEPACPDGMSVIGVDIEVVYPTRQCEHGCVLAADSGPSDDDLVRWLYRNGLMAQSVERCKPLFPRWRRFLEENEVSSINPAGAHCSNLLNLLVRQAADVRIPAIEHNLRDLARIRPYKG